MEAIASGALIFVDRMFVPRPYPLIEGVHVIYYGTLQYSTVQYSTVQYSTANSIKFFIDMETYLGFDNSSKIILNNFALISY